MPLRGSSFHSEKKAAKTCWHISADSVSWGWAVIWLTRQKQTRSSTSVSSTWVTRTRDRAHGCITSHSQRLWGLNDWGSRGSQSSISESSSSSSSESSVESVAPRGLVVGSGMSAMEGSEFDTDSCSCGRHNNIHSTVLFILILMYTDEFSASGLTCCSATEIKRKKNKCYLEWFYTRRHLLFYEFLQRKISLLFDSEGLNLCFHTCLL